MLRGLIILGIIGTVSFVVITNISGDKEQPEMVDTQANRTMQNSQMTSARTAYIDPETGELTTAPDASLSVNKNQPDLNLPPVKITTHANGMVQADLNGRFRTPLQAVIGCNGEVITEHSEKPLSKPIDCEAEH